MKEGFYGTMSRNERHDVSGTLESAYRKAEGYLEEKRIDMESFKPPYGNYDSAMVDRDLSVVANLELKFDESLAADPAAREAKHVATVFEALIARNVTESMWFGGNAVMVHASKYDDYVNGVDGVLHVKDSTSHNNFLALGIDASFSLGRVEGKIRKVLEEIREGHMARIKYFSLPGAFKGELSSVPRIVMGAEASTVLQMSEQWMAGNETGFKNHWMQYQLLESSIDQCRAFADYARSQGKTEIEASYKSLSSKFESIARLRAKLITDSGDRDRMFERIKDLLPRS